MSAKPNYDDNDIYYSLIYLHLLITNNRGTISGRLFIKTN